MPDAESRGTDFDLIYAHHAAEYHELVSREDWQGNLPRALFAAADFEDRNVVELGAGTGRITALIAGKARHVHAFDKFQSMLDHAGRVIAEQGISNVTFAAADNRAVPLADSSADIVVEGWSFGHTVIEGGAAWRGAAEGLIRESERLLKPGGTLILIETLGTGVRMPAAPGPILPVFFGLLERQLGFRAEWIRTDYRFPSLTEARRLVQFFFGAMTDHDLTAGGEVIVPECTGIWARQKSVGKRR